MKHAEYISFRRAWMPLLAVLVLCAACRLAPGKMAQETSTRNSNLKSDPLLYGVCLGTTADSLHFFTDEGDTLWLFLADNIEVGGALNAGDRLALMLRPGDKDVVLRAVNTTMLIGDWVEPDPVSEGNVKGFMLSSGGAAQAINVEDLVYESWSIYEGRLLVHGIYGAGTEQSFTDTLTIVNLLADSLIVEGMGAKHFMHRLRPGEANYENAAYDFDTDPEAGEDFNPESDEVEVSPEALEEGPVY